MWNTICKKHLACLWSLRSPQVSPPWVLKHYTCTIWVPPYTSLTQCELNLLSQLRYHWVLVHIEGLRLRTASKIVTKWPFILLWWANYNSACMKIQSQPMGPVPILCHRYLRHQLVLIQSHSQTLRVNEHWLWRYSSNVAQRWSRISFVRLVWIV